MRTSGEPTPTTASPDISVIADRAHGQDVPTELVMEDKTSAEQVRLIAQLNNRDESTMLSIIDIMLTKQKLQEFFQQNISTQ